MTEPVDFFIHIPKTAGSTLEGIIAAQYPPGSVLNLRQNAVSHDERTARLRALPLGIRIVCGHLHYGFLAAVPRPARAFTMLRDPVERVISLYYYIAREPRHATHEAFKRGEITMEKLARRQGRAQACFLAGITPRDAMPDAELVARAKENLERNMTAVGITERFDESLLLYNRALGWKVGGYIRENVTRNRPTQDRLAEADLAVIRAHSSVDQAIYEFARTLFEQRVAAAGPAFAEELASLRRKVTVTRNVGRVQGGLRLLARKLGLGRSR
jgi:hypothetical protein